MPVLLAGLAAFLLGVGDFLAGLGGRRTKHPGAAMSLAWVASVVGAIVAGLFVLVVPPEAFGAADFWWSIAATVFVSRISSVGILPRASVSIIRWISMTSSFS